MLPAFLGSEYTRINLPPQRHPHQSTQEKTNLQTEVRALVHPSSVICHSDQPKSCVAGAQILRHPLLQP